jgi:thiosulfate/3-mercaptopyruvate sulfurtransferase
MDRNNALIEVDELLAKLGNDKLRIYDATMLFFQSQSAFTSYELYQQGHIPGAAFFDHQKFLDPASDYMSTLLPEARIAEQIGRLGISEDSEVILYASGVLPAATRAWWILRYAGHDNVRVLNGGLSAWKKAEGTLEQGIRHYEPSTFEPHFRQEMFASKEEVLAAMDNADVGIVNVLPLQSYDAEHITGSTCVSCMDLMQGMDSFVPDDQLALRLKDASRHKRIITYCGGGIAATANAMAYLIIGHENVAVYNGSMFEWTGEGLPTTGTGLGHWAIWE